MRAVQFTVAGPASHFRQPIAVNNRLTFAFPPRTTVLGMLGACLGLDYEEMVARTRPWLVGVEYAPESLATLRKSITVPTHKGKRKKLISDAGQDFDGTDRITFHYNVANSGDEVVYKITVVPDDADVDELQQALHQPIYSVSLGRSECLATIRDVTVVDCLSTEQAGQIVGGVRRVRKTGIRMMRQLNEQRNPEELAFYAPPGMPCDEPVKALEVNGDYIGVL